MDPAEEATVRIDQATATTTVAGDGPPPHALDGADVAAELGTDAATGLGSAEVATRLGQYGPNAIAAEKPPSIWEIALVQLREPMNIMLIAVVVVSLVIGEVSTGVVVGLLILLNLVLGTRQELQARASIDALSNLQVPTAGSS